MASREGFDEIVSAVHSNGGILTLDMEELREAHKVKKLGPHVRKAIHDNLQRRGIGHLPVNLPAYQEQSVRLYTLGSRFANLLGELEDYSEEADKRLMDLSANDDGETIEKIRELVC